MKKLLLTLALCMGYLCTTVAQTFVKTEVKQSMRRVADWQIAHYNKAIYGDLNWVNATFYLGLVHWAAIEMIHTTNGCCGWGTAITGR